MTTTTCVTGAIPTGAPVVPTEDEFGDYTYLDAPSIERIADALIERKPEFAHLGMYSIGYFWKVKAGKKMGKVVAGKESKASGLLAYKLQATYVIEVSADVARTFNNLQLEALVYHELCHLGVDEDDDGNTTPRVAAHDIEMFLAEYRSYGPWHLDLVNAERTFQQTRLDLSPEERRAQDDTEFDQPTSKTNGRKVAVAT